MERRRSYDLETPVSDEQGKWHAAYLDDDTPWDKGAPSPGLIDWLAGHKFHGRVLVPGSGRGHDVPPIAESADEVVAIDLSEKATELAAASNPCPNARYRAADFFDLPQEFHSAFDWVWEHTSFCAIEPPRRRAWLAAMRQVLKPGGKLLGVFYLAPESETEGPPFKIARADLEALLSEYFTIEEQWAPEHHYPSRANAERFYLLS
jgi:SAM-dependent methyltransferase